MSRRTTALLVAAFAVLMVAVGLAVSVVDDGGGAAEAAPGTACIGDPPLVAVNLGFNGESAVTVVQPDGRQDVVTPPDWVATDPDFTPDRTRLVVAEADGDFESAGPGGSRLWSIGVDGSDPRPVTAEGGDDTDPAVSPDGATVAYRSGSSLATVPLAGGAPTVLVTGAVGDGVTAPEWSPTGERIAYVRLTWDAATSTEATEVWTVAPDGSGAAPLVASPGARTLDWSPDGSQILVSTDGGPGSGSGAGSVSVVDVAAGTIRPLADGAVRARWSRGGTQAVLLAAVDAQAYRLVERTVAGVDGADVSGGADRDLGVTIGFLYPYLDVAVASCPP